MHCRLTEPDASRDSESGQGFVCDPLRHGTVRPRTVVDGALAGCARAPSNDGVGEMTHRAPVIVIAGQPDVVQQLVDDACCRCRAHGLEVDELSGHARPRRLPYGHADYLGAHIVGWDLI